MSLPIPPDIIAAAQAGETATNVPASISIAQWILESGRGAHMPPGSNNPFGIKALPGQPSVVADTEEFLHGEMVHVQGVFRKFDSVALAFVAHAQLLATKPIYQNAMAYTDDPKAFAWQLVGTYATDPDYATKLIAIMDDADLYQYDRQQTLSV